MDLSAKQALQIQTQSVSFSVAEWLGQWANLGVNATTECLGGCAVGSNPPADMSRIGFIFIQGGNFNGFT